MIDNSSNIGGNKPSETPKRDIGETIRDAASWATVGLIGLGGYAKYDEYCQENEAQNPKAQETRAWFDTGEAKNFLRIIEKMPVNQNANWNDLSAEEQRQITEAYGRKRLAELHEKKPYYNEGYHMDPGF